MTAGGHRHALPDPFFVLATQNPIEQEGTYPAARGPARPVPVQDLHHLSRRPRRSGGSTGSPPACDQPEITPLISGERIAALQRLVRRVPVSDHCIDYAMDLVRATRGPEHGGPKYIGDWVSWGAGPRAGQSLILAAKARAALAGRPSVSVDDIRAVARPVLRHRIVINYNAQAAGESSDSIVKRLLDDVPVRKGAADAAVAEVFRS